VAEGLIHVVGIFVQIDARLRQRCAWCGAVLLDYDLERIAVPEGQGGPSTWPTGALVEVDGPMSRVVPRTDDEPLPEGTCTAIDHEVTGKRATDV
jgi:hypothetical protein